jgi:hypothetical protein
MEAGQISVGGSCARPLYQCVRTVALVGAVTYSFPLVVDPAGDRHSYEPFYQLPIFCLPLSAPEPWRQEAARDSISVRQ